jgi:hypothetical protein
MVPPLLQVSPKYALDDLYLMVASIYGEQNAQRSPSSTFAHFVEVCGMLTIHDRKKKREGLELEDALCKALGWFLDLSPRLRQKFRHSKLANKDFAGQTVSVLAESQ